MIYHKLYALELELKDIIKQYNESIRDSDMEEKIRIKLNEILINHSKNSTTYIISEVEVKLTGFSLDFRFNELKNIIPYWSVA